MTLEVHKKAFIDNIITHISLADIKYAKENVDGQNIVRVMVDSHTPEDDSAPNYRTKKKSIIFSKKYTIIDPNYDNLYASFIGNDFNLETIEYVKSSIEGKTREEIAAFIVEYFVKPIIDKNIDSKTLYFVTDNDNDGWESDIWSNTISIPNNTTVENFVKKIEV